ncbi:MAG: hypothetical protein ACYSTT_00700 [Planctomycetota bacterium]
MTEMKTKNKCRRIRGWLYTAISRSFGPEANWLNEHITHCPRCQQRLISCGKVNLALSFMKSQPHALDLLMRANTQAIAVLKHSLRLEPKAQKLEKKLPEPKILERWSKYGHSVANLAACFVILLLMKIGVFSSMEMNHLHNQGQRVMKQYYTRQVGEDLADEVFPNNSKSSPSASSRGFNSV